MDGNGWLDLARGLKAIIFLAMVQPILAKDHGLIGPISTRQFKYFHATMGHEYYQYFKRMT
jgi:hypothetical protein